MPSLDRYALYLTLHTFLSPNLAVDACGVEPVASRVSS